MTHAFVALKPVPIFEAKPFAEIVRNFTPNWFTVTMGTGVLALTLNQFPLDVPGIHRTAVTLWLADIGLFVLFSVLYAARWVLFFDGARRIFHHPVMSMFFGAIPMGLATIINGFLAFGPPLLGDSAIAVAHVLWWAQTHVIGLDLTVMSSKFDVKRGYV